MDEKKDLILKEKRIEYLDFCRAIAIICVVLCHSVEYMYYGEGILWNNLTTFSRYFSTILYVIGRIGVPFFLFISGELLLSKNFEKEENIKKFYIKNFLAMLITTEIWMVIYTIFLDCEGIQKFNLEKLIKNMLFLADLPLMNIWYMPMILGIYLVTPFIAQIVRKNRLKYLLIPLGIGIAINMLIPTINVFLDTYGIKSVLVSRFNVAFLGGFTAIYYITGYFVRNGLLKKANTKLLILITILSFIICCGIQINAFNNSFEYRVWYNLIFLYILTVSLFEIIRRIDFSKINYKILERITNFSKKGLAVYFIHIIWIMFLGKYIIDFGRLRIIRCAILFVATMVLSILFIDILSKVKFIKQKLFYIK